MSNLKTWESVLMEELQRGLYLEYDGENLSLKERLNEFGMRYIWNGDSDGMSEPIEIDRILKSLVEKLMMQGSVAIVMGYKVGRLKEVVMFTESRQRKSDFEMKMKKRFDEVQFKQIRSDTIDLIFFKMIPDIILEKEAKDMKKENENEVVEQMNSMKQHVEKEVVVTGNGVIVEKADEMIEETEDFIDADNFVKLLEELDSDEIAISEKRKKWQQECEMRGHKTCEAIVGVSNNLDYELVLRAVGEGHKRKYNLYEREVGGKQRKRGFLKGDCMFSVSQIRKDPGMKDVIHEFYGDYSEKENDIILKMKSIENARVLDIFEQSYEESPEELVEKIKYFMLTNPLTDGIVHLDIKSKMEVGIIGDATIYEKLMQKIMPGCNVAYINAVLKDGGYFKITGNEKYRHTRNIERNRAIGMGWPTDKFYDLNFGDDFVKEYMEVYQKMTEETKNGD